MLNGWGISQRLVVDFIHKNIYNGHCPAFPYEYLGYDGGKVFAVLNNLITQSFTFQQ